MNCIKCEINRKARHGERNIRDDDDALGFGPGEKDLFRLYVLALGDLVNRRVDRTTRLVSERAANTTVLTKKPKGTT